MRMSARPDPFALPPDAIRKIMSHCSVHDAASLATVVSRVLLGMPEPSLLHLSHRVACAISRTSVLNARHVAERIAAAAFTHRKTVRGRHYGRGLGLGLGEKVDDLRASQRSIDAMLRYPASTLVHPTITAEPRLFVYIALKVWMELPVPTVRSMIVHAIAGVTGTPVGYVSSRTVQASRDSFRYVEKPRNGLPHYALNLLADEIVAAGRVGHEAVLAETDPTMMRLLGIAVGYFATLGDATLR